MEVFRHVDGGTIDLSFPAQEEPSQAKGVPNVEDILTEYRIKATAQESHQVVVESQDGRALRRYKRRWTVERTIARLGNFRRLVVRYGRSLTIYRAFIQIACFMITLPRVLK